MFRLNKIQVYLKYTYKSINVIEKNTPHFEQTNHSQVEWATIFVNQKDIK